MCDTAIMLSAVPLALSAMADILDHQLVVDHQSNLDRKFQKLAEISRQCGELCSLLGLRRGCWQNNSCHVQLVQPEITLFGIQNSIHFDAKSAIVNVSTEVTLDGSSEALGSDIDLVHMSRS